MKNDDRFQEIRDKYLVNNYPTQTIYHYTNFNGLNGILESNRLWLTNYRYLNDPSEIVFSLNEICRQITDIISRFGLNSINGDFSKKIQLNIKKYYDFYIFSFCGEENYLPAWRWYANNGSGYAIGFIPSQSNSVEPRASNESSSITIRCCYSSHECLNFLEDLLSTYENFPTEENIRWLVYCIMHIIPQIKHNGYKEEHEYRLCMIEENENVPLESRNVRIPDELRIWRDSKYTDSPFVNTIPTIAFPFDKEEICEIWVGPRCNFEHAKKELRSLLDRLEYSHVEIRRSDIPYRL